MKMQHLKHMKQLKLYIYIYTFVQLKQYTIHPCPLAITKGMLKKAKITMLMYNNNII